jgi:hypothetical protein
MVATNKTSTVAMTIAVRPACACLTGAGSRVQLSNLAVAQGWPDAKARMDEGLDRSFAAHSTPLVSLRLVGFARLALAEGHPERAARLAGAADGLRRRVGLRAWPMLRRGEAELVAQVRQAVGADRFDQLYAAGSRLNQREAVAAGRDRRGAGAAASWVTACTQLGRWSQRPAMATTSGKLWRSC